MASSQIDARQARGDRPDDEPFAAGGWLAREPDGPGHRVQGNAAEQRVLHVAKPLLNGS